ncbi:Putative predicted metal-dependent hydrolase [plant metagenome]|uniref:Predicted metal-dependent hydrolase n=1 Tax=plant metagenome TaxID=1297885 RepID=A0A484R529_9ZZZZ
MMPGGRVQLDLFDPVMPAPVAPRVPAPPASAPVQVAPDTAPVAPASRPVAPAPARPPAAPAARPAAPPAPPSLAPSRPSATPASRVPTPRPPSLPDGARWRETGTEQQAIGYVLLRSRRRSIGFVIGDDGLRVTAPNWVTLAQVDEAVREKSRWILSKLRDWHTRQERLALAHTRWQAGGELPYLGRRIQLQLGTPPAAEAGAARPANPRAMQAIYSGDPERPQDGDTLWLPLPPDADHARIRDSAQAWLQRRAAQWFDVRLKVFLDRSGLRINRWRLSSATTRWGSCTSDGNISLNWRLIHFAPDIIDYVIAHELAHLREMNHSHDFWAEVGQILPDYEAARDVLRKHAPGDLPG